MSYQPNPRPRLTESEWKRVKVKAAQQGVTIGQFTANALRAALKGAKP